MNKKKKRILNMCATIRICKTCKYIKCLKGYGSIQIETSLIFETRYLKKKKEKEKERFCIFNIGFMRCTFNSYSYRRTCTPKSFCEWIKHVNFLHKGYYDIMYYD